MSRINIEEKQARAMEQTDMETPNLTHDELAILAKIIELGSARGIFAATELGTVGALYARLLSLAQSTQNPSTEG